MRILSRQLASAAAALLLATASAASADQLAGRWDATVTINGTVIPFRLDLAGDGAGFTGTLFNGSDTQTTTRATHENDQIVLELEHYLTTIVATEQHGELVGKVQMRNDKDGNGSPFKAARHVAPAPVNSAAVPNIDGVWEIPHESPKGEKAWRFIVKQSGAELQAAILRVDGDTGALTGRYKDGTFVISHFDGSRPALMHVTPAADGTLAIVQQGSNRDGALTAYRPEVARAKGLPEPSNYQTHTTVRDPNEVFTFNFPDVDGKILSNEDPKFKGKVIVAVVTGTWCPNCHDEAQYLVPLYKQYRDRGLEVVALDFEEPEQQDELTRVKAFMAKYGVEYTYLIAGAPAEMWEKVPQAVNLNTWPATIFVGRDGRVKSIHAGFAAPASGEFNDQLKAEFTATVERLLAEPTSTQEQ
jgi:thiol-disulfide isomerase/thioredoxin